MLLLHCRRGLRSLRKVRRDPAEFDGNALPRLVRAELSGVCNLFLRLAPITTTILAASSHFRTDL